MMRYTYFTVAIVIIHEKKEDNHDKFYQSQKTKYSKQSKSADCPERFSGTSVLIGLAGIS